MSKPRGAAAPIVPDESYTVDAETGCWLWQRGTDGRYGRFWAGDTRVKAHRWFFERVHGPVPPGLVIDHLCGITRCVNPDHMEAVTQVENMRRAKHVKLSLEIAEQIRRAEGTPDELAERFGTSDRTVRSILKGEAWT